MVSGASWKPYRATNEVRIRQLGSAARLGPGGMEKHNTPEYTVVGRPDPDSSRAE